MASKPILSWMESYLSEPGLAQVKELTTFGLDQDLAITLAETQFTEEEFYELPDRKDKGSRPWND